jgi:AcrR family transcriptional regulator
MPRHIPEDRFDRLVDCATQVFIEQGYRRAQMADVAEAMGVAKGTLYLYVESKEALFDLACRQADAESPRSPPPNLPIPTPKPGATLEYIAARLAESGVPRTLQAALERRRAADALRELEAIVRELYGTLSRNRRGLKLIDRSAPDLPELAVLWFEGARGGMMSLLAEYLERRIRADRFRPVPDTTAAARLIIETIVFWSVHRHWDAHPEAVSETVAENTVVHFIVGGLAIGTRRSL